MKVTRKNSKISSALALAALLVFSRIAPAGAQDALGGSRPSTVLPTDTAPLPLPNERQALGESLKLRLWQKLPARFYFSGTVESSFRIETNVFQFPSRSRLLSRFAPDGLDNLSPQGAQSVQNLLDRSYAEDVVYRITPNITAGWALTPYTRFFTNYFMLRDTLIKNYQLDSTLNQIGIGIEHSRPIPKTRLQYELQFTARELFQQGTDPVFDYIPSFTLSMPVTKNYSTVAYFNSIVQLRSTHFACLPNRNITPFYTFGLAHTRKRWSFSANATMLNTYQKGFSAARLDQNSGSWICDFEVARQVLDDLPGFQAFVRCEPVFNFEGHGTPGLSGNDVRIFFGLRMSAYKPNLLGTMQMLKQHYQPQEPKQPRQKKNQPEPGAEPGKDGDGKEKKDNTTPGAPVSLEDNDSSSDDFSVISLKTNASLSPIGRSIDKRSGRTFVMPASSTEAPPLLADYFEAKKLNDYYAAQEEKEFTPPPAPMHGFLESSVENEDAPEKISALTADTLSLTD